MRGLRGKGNWNPRSRSPASSTYGEEPPKPAAVDTIWKGWRDPIAATEWKIGSLPSALAHLYLIFRSTCAGAAAATGADDEDDDMIIERVPFYSANSERLLVVGRARERVPRKDDRSTATPLLYMIKSRAYRDAPHMCERRGSAECRGELESLPRRFSV